MKFPFSDKQKYFCHLRLGIVLSASASNQWKILTGNLAGQGSKNNKEADGFKKRRYDKENTV